MAVLVPTDAKTLVDEYDKIQRLKKEIAEREGELKQGIIKIAEQDGKSILFGTNMFCSVKSYDKVVFPEDKTIFVNLIRQKGVYDKVSSVNYLKLGSMIKKGEIDSEIADMTKKEKAFRVVLKEKGF